MTQILRKAKQGIKHIGTSTIVLLVQSFVPALKPFAQLGSILWLPLHKRQKGLKKSQVLSLFAKEIVLFTILEKLVSKLAPDFHRTLRFWNLYLPLHTRYLFTRLKYSEKRGYSWQEVESKWDERHTWGAPRICSLLQKLSGYYVKSAQVLASKGDFLPHQWTEELTPIFFDNMKPHSWDRISKNLGVFLEQSELAQTLDRGRRDALIQDIKIICNTESIASASIAQVHAGTLSKNVLESMLENGFRCSEVVFKVQHTDMQTLMDSDIRNLRRLCKFIRSMLPYDPSPLLDEMAETVGKEFDFRREAVLMDAIRKRLQESNLAISIPRPIFQLTTENLLVMEYMEGIPVSTILQRKDKELMKKAGNSLTDLMHAYGHMIFIDGLFHGDPHAGNLLLSPDEKLVLLDFGQCRALAPERHLAFAKLVIAIDDGSTWGIVRALSEFKMDFRALSGGIPDPQLIKTFAIIAFDTRPLPEAMINPLAEDSVIKKIPLMKAPEDFFSLGRAIMLLRGLCHALGVNIQAAKIWRPYAEQAIRESKNFHEKAEINVQLDLGIGLP